MSKHLIAALTVTATAAALIAAPTAATAAGFGYDDARSHTFKRPDRVAATTDGGFLVSEIHGAGPIVRYSPEDRSIEKVAGGGSEKVELDPIPARSASLFGPTAIAPTSDGGFLVAVSADDYVAKVTANGRIYRIAGGGSSGQDGIPASDARLDSPTVLAAREGGGFLVGSYMTWDIAEVDGEGTITTAAGTGEFGISPDGAVADESPIGYVLGATATPDGGFIFSEWAGDYAKLRKVRPDGSLTTIAGTGTQGYSGDGGPATAAELQQPGEVDVTADGSIVFVDGPRVRRVDPGGTITTVAGNGSSRYDDDAIPAVDAAIGPTSVSALPGGGFLIGDFGLNQRVRRVGTDGEISTLAGMPKPSFCEQAPYNGIQGGSGGDSLRGGKLRDLIRGEFGDDELSGRGESDCIVGGGDDDRIDGGSKSDGIDGENGNDRMRGGNGADVIVGQDGRDRLSGGAGNDELDGDMDADRIAGGDGNDEIVGETGRDRLSGGKGNDYIDAQDEERESFGGPADIVRCGPGRDTVKANTYDRVARDCERLKGAIVTGGPD